MKVFKKSRLLCPDHYQDLMLKTIT